ncbi:uncharacterized protein V6R79_024014 [Siganus canaliculatus]
MPPSVFKGVDLQASANNREHRTSEISTEKLTVRRGQAFSVSLNLRDAFNGERHPLHFTAATGEHPSEQRGTLALFSVPDRVRRSPGAKAWWKVEYLKSSSPRSGVVKLSITPPADAPVGRYTVTVKHREETTELGTVVLLFNPWCPEDWVFLPSEEERQEYVMNDQGIVYRGSGNYISRMTWDYGQFEDDMVEICLKILDLNRKHLLDPADDVSARCNPIYVGRVISAMINVQDDRGVVVGRWDGSYESGFSPSHWTGSHRILKMWYANGGRPVRYGQCWVFACVMCSVMRLLGIPCRVVSNFQSAHDVDRNLTIDVYHSDVGVEERQTLDSIWNFHVWTEGWMKRPDLSNDGKYDGWQVLDPTPQETSGAVLDGETNLKYDVPFVFAEVNADCVDWLIKRDGSKVKISTDSKRVGQYISTKAVGSNRRMDITNTYKYREGSDKERSVFKYANTRDYSRVDRPEEDPYMVNARSAVPSPRMARMASVETREAAREENVEAASSAPPMHLQFEEVSEPVNGADVSLKLLVQSRSSDSRPLSINISVQAMRYNGAPAGKIQSEVTEQTLEPGKDLSVPVLVPFSAYGKLMRNSESMKISAIVTDKQNPDQVYMAESDVVLLNPSISVTVSRKAAAVCVKPGGQVSFLNPLDETLRNCTLTLSGGGVWKEDVELTFQDLTPGKRLQTEFSFTPYKTGQKTIVATLDCSAFRDIKGSCTIDVEP